MKSKNGQSQHQISLRMRADEAKALLKYLQYYTGFKDVVPGDDECERVDGVARALWRELKFHQSRVEKREKRKKEGEIANLLRQQMQDMAETGHGKVEELESEVLGG